MLRDLAGVTGYCRGVIDFSNMLGRPLATVSLSSDKSEVTFRFQDGGSRSFAAHGDCCSQSWIEHLETPTDVSGATLMSVEDSAPVTQDHPDHDGDHRDNRIEVYNTVFRTTAGDVVLEYRNSSNGYYGGYLVDA